MTRKGADFSRLFFFIANSTTTGGQEYQLHLLFACAPDGELLREQLTGCFNVLARDMGAACQMLYRQFSTCWG